jgi:hypothetical protein
VLTVAVVVVSAGAGVDMMIGNGVGPGLTISFLLACAGMALRLPLRLVAAAVIAAPLLFAAATTAIAQVAGDAQGLRQLGLDVATSLALSAPGLFAGTGLAVAIAVCRVTLHLFRRRH